VAQQWSGEQNLGGNLFGTPAVAQLPGLNVLQVFYEGGDNALWTRWRNSDGSWSAEQSLGGQLYSGSLCDTYPSSECVGFNETPAVVQLPNTNDLLVFYRGSDSTLRYNFRDNNGNWLGEANLGGQIWGNPAAVQVPGTNQIEVFYRGSDGNLKTQWGNQSSWTYETDMGGQLFGPTCSDITNDSCYGAYATPAVIQLPNSNYLEVFYRAPDNTLRSRLRDPITYWGPEGNFGGHLTSDPSVAPIPGTAEIEVYYRGLGALAGTLMTQWGDINRWTYETQVPGATLSGYVCGSYAPYSGCQSAYSAPQAYNVGNDLWVFFRAPNIAETQWQIAAYSQQQNTVTYMNANLPISDPIAAPIPGTNTVQIFYLEFNASGGNLASRWYPN
jgi:hypothetical protein